MCCEINFDGDFNREMNVAGNVVLLETVLLARLLDIMGSVSARSANEVFAMLQNCKEFFLYAG